MKGFARLLVFGSLGILALGVAFSAFAREDDDLQKLIDSCTEEVTFSLSW